LWSVGAFSVQDAALQREGMECRHLAQGIVEFEGVYSLIRFKVGDSAKKPMWCCSAACEFEGKERSWMERELSANGRLRMYTPRRGSSYRSGFLSRTGET
jgi:hypothetical protein